MKIITFRREPTFVIGYWKYTHRLTAGRPYVFFNKEIEKIEDNRSYFDVRDMDPEPPAYGGEDLDGRSLLFVSLGGYGDALCFLQALNTLQRRFPGAGIDVCTHLDLYFFIRQFGFRGGWIPYPLKLRDLKRYDCYQTSDTIYSFPDAHRRNIARLYGMTLHVAPDISNAPFTAADIPDLRPAERETRRRRKIAIQVNTEKGSFRNYPPEKIGRLAELLGKAGFEVFLVGNVSHPALRRPRPGLRDCIGRTATPLELAGLLSRMDLIITPDSLSAHIGGTLGIPTLVIFNVTGREKTDHYPSVVPLSPERPCSPCYALFHCPEGHGFCRALDEAGLSPEAILDRAAALAGGSAPRRAAQKNDPSYKPSGEVRVQ